MYKLPFPGSSFDQCGNLPLNFIDFPLPLLHDVLASEPPKSFIIFSTVGIQRAFILLGSFDAPTGAYLGPIF